MTAGRDWRADPDAGRYTDPFWDALEEDRFLLHRCRDCEEAFFPPAPVCPRCGRTDVAWVEADGQGRLVSFTRQHVAPPGFEAPLALGIVELVEGPRLLAGLPQDAAPSLDATVELTAVGYDAGYDRGDRSGRPFFAARIVE